jgi:SpoVK/Ycf46/Vps4 family AAA+-type ATPase
MGGKKWYQINDSDYSVQIDQDGVSVRTTITKKTLSLIGNVSNYSASLKNEPVKDSLFEITYGRSIDDITLHYSDSIDSIFNDFSELSKKISKNENLSLLLHGAPGTGKTAFAQQVVKRVNGTLYQLNFSQIQSKWVGETEKNIRRVFNAYHEAWEKSTEPIILLINEADGLMNKRVTVNTSNDSFANQAQTELLEQLEKFNGILIATTNLLRNIDSAFHRRFLFKSEIQAPDEISRSNYLKGSAIYPLLNSSQIAMLNSSPFTIAEMKNIEQKICLIQRIREISSIDIDALFRSEGIIKNTTKAIGYDIN